MQKIDSAYREKLRMLKLSEISLLLSSYDDIFSDFDPRPYDVRSLSEDFLAEAKRASREKNSGKIELKLLVPRGKRSPKQEKIIKHRLHEHFKKHHGRVKQEMQQVARRGMIFVLFGVICMLFASILLSGVSRRDIFYNFIIVLLEPGGWFLFWEGLNLIVFESKRKRGTYRFYQKMSESTIKFVAY